MARDHPRPRPAFATWLILLAGVALFAGVVTVRRIAARPGELERLVEAGAPEQHIHALAAGADGTLYAGTHLGLLQSRDGRRWQAAGLVTGDVLTVSSGAEATLYLAGPEIGVVRMAGAEAEQVLNGPVLAAAASPLRRGALAAVVGRQVWTSRDAGSTWTRVSELPEPDLYAISLDPEESATLIVAGLSGQVYISGDGGLSWVPGGRLSGAVTALAAELAPPHRLWAAAGGRIWVSPDRGRSWTARRDRSGGLAAIGLALRPAREGQQVLAVTADGTLFKQTE